MLTLPHETNTVSDAISILTPTGVALLGLKTGDDIQRPIKGISFTFTCWMCATPDHDPGNGTGY